MSKPCDWPPVRTRHRGKVRKVDLIPQYPGLSRMRLCERHHAHLILRGVIPT
jgi:hypothetical protein